MPGAAAAGRTPTHRLRRRGHSRCLDISQMLADVYGVHNVEFQHSLFPSTEVSYLKELRAHIEKTKSRMQQINLEFGSMNISADNPVQRIQAIDLTKRWVDYAVILNCPKVMVNQGRLTAQNQDIATATLKTMGDYAQSRGVEGVHGDARQWLRARPPRRRAGCEHSTGAGGTARLDAPERRDREVQHVPANIDIGGVGAPNQEALHEAAKALLPTNSGQSHIKVSPNWDLATFVKYYESIGYKGLYTLELRGFQNIRPVYETVLTNI